ncbi:hypothetical protein ACFSRY_09865 [Pontibacter locisalis]|uniref:Type 1 periplasmic binding fold superfamily protein n=1 Tax=Pontibacter locisalis TaxID=1719035 RepID=A0ABW5IMK9_9BACT
MKRLLRPYLALLMMGSLMFTTTACSDDDPEPVEEQELITTLTINLQPEAGKGQPVSATFSDPDGPGGSDPTVSTLNLVPNTTYTATITVSDDSPNGAGNLTPEIEAEGDEHELFYTVPSGLNLTVSKTDLDKNNRPIGLEATFVTGAASSGTMKVTLKHQPGLKGNTSDITKGETDVEADFPVVIQ